MTDFYLILLVLSFLALHLFMGTRRRKNELPGPRKWPILGNLPQIARINWTRIWCAIDHYAKEYGDIYGMYFGPRYVVVLSNPKIVHELLKRDEWNGRSRDHLAKIKADGNAVLGLIMTDGELWRETRRFSLKHLRDFGFGKATMETSIMEEVGNVVKHLDAKLIKSHEEGCKEGVVTFESTFGPAVISTLWFMVAGVHVEIDDPKVLKLQQIVQDTLRRRAFGAGIFWSFQKLGQLFSNQSGFAKQAEGFNTLKTSMREIIAEHKQTRVLGQPRDFIDAYLDEHDNNPENRNFFEEQLVVTCMDMFVAGIDTMTNTLRFAILYLIMHPKVQVKIQEEIYSVVGHDRSVTLQDKDKLPYCKSFLMEVNRCGSVAPILTPHALTKTVHYQQYEIPKGSLVFVNTWAIHRNKGHWGDPEEFRPERFIQPNGKVVPNDEWLLPFGSGKRRCPAEPLGEASVFLMICNLVQKFSFFTVPAEPLPSTLPVIGLSLSPHPFRALTQRRKV